MRTIKIYSMEDLLNNTELFNKAYELNRLNFTKNLWYDTEWYENNTFVKSFHKILLNFGETGSSIDLFNNGFVGRFNANCFSKVVPSNVLDILLEANRDLIHVNKVQFCLDVNRKFIKLYDKYKRLIESYDNDLEFFWNTEKFIGIESRYHNQKFDSEKHLFLEIFEDLNTLYLSVYNFAYECLASKETFKQENFNSEFFEDGTICQ